MDASGNSSSKIYYSYVDLERETEVAYYKLKQTDFNGVFEYFDPISVQICGTRFSELYVYPNPLKDKINISFDGNENTINLTTICDVFGKVLYRSEIYKTTIPFKQPDGIYFLHLNTGHNKLKRYLS